MKNILILFLVLTIKVSAQNAVSENPAPANTFSLSALAPLNFNYNSTLELSQPKIIPNAIQLNMKVKQETVGVFGQVSFFGSTLSPFANKMALKMKYSDSPNANAPTNDVILSGHPALLLTQPGGFSGVKDFKYLFDLTLNPPESFEGLSNQSYSVTYTISML